MQAQMLPLWAWMHICGNVVQRWHTPTNPTLHEPTEQCHRDTVYFCMKRPNKRLSQAIVPLTYWGREKWPPFCSKLFQIFFLIENIWISIKISLKFVPKSPNHNIPALVQIMAWCRQVTSHYLKQRWINYSLISASLGLNELMWCEIMIRSWLNIKNHITWINWLNMR